MAAKTEHHHAASETAPAVIRDPVCGMTVDASKDGPSALHDGRTFQFCSAGCKTRFEAAPQDYLTATDPVCGMQVDRASARFMSKHEGQRTYFCSAGCQHKFDADPESFAGPRPAPAPAAAGTRWTCPMHPEIDRDKPGDCPICGMALEPATATAGSGPNPEYLDFRRRIWLAGPLAAVVFALEMGSHVGIPFETWLGPKIFVWTQAVLATLVIGLTWMFFRRGWASVVNRSPNMWTLIALRHRGGLRLQPGRPAGAGDIPARDAGPSRPAAGLFRGRRGDPGAGAGRPADGTGGARTDRRRDPGAAGPGAEDRAAGPRRAGRGRGAGAQVRSAMSCGSARARRCRSTAP